MKAFPLLLAVLFLVGCDVKKMISVEEPATPAPTPKPVATPQPTPKHGEWLYDKNRRSALDPPSRK